MESWVEADGSGCLLWVQVQPRAKRSELAGLHGGALKLRVTAPPVDGAANAAVVRLLAELLGIAAGRIGVTGGATSRRKRVLVTGLSEAEIRERLRVGGMPGA
jgi:uncharacterized protein (TIGR00251 family)